MSPPNPTTEALLASKAIAAFRQPPRELFPVAARYIADFAGVAVAGAAAKPVLQMAETLDTGGGSNRNRARLILNGKVVPWATAAVVNGMAGHFHDYDDDDPVASIGHPSVTTLAAALAVADALDSPSDSLVAAYIMGVETTMRIGLLANPAHYNSGWHATATLGVYGATIAAGLLMGLDEEQLTHALGIAASLGSGVKANFGSDMKALQVGHAAGNGLWAAELAQRGVKAAPGSLFGERGLLRMTGASNGAHAGVEQFGAPYCLVNPGVNIKLYPCCSSCHTAVDAILDLMTEHAVAAKDLARIDVWVGKDVPQILIYDVPATGLEGKFSLRYCLAAAALAGGLTLSDFTDDALSRPGLMELIGRTHQHIDPSFAPCGATGVTHQARVKIETKSGVVAERLVTDPLGSTARPLPESRLREKFVSCARDGLGAEPAEVAFRSLMKAGTDGSARRLIDMLIQA